MIAVFDGHNDFLQRMVAAGDAAPGIWQSGDGSGHLDLPRMRAGGLAGGFFAIWVPSPHRPEDDGAAGRMASPPFTMPLPPEIDAATAQAHALAQAAKLFALARTGTLRICRSVDEIRDAMAQGQIAAILHMEGAEAIADMDALHLWHAMGLRSLGPVWSRPTRFGHGVPFAFPASPETGPGLTEAGRALVRECNRLRIMIDLAHLNAAGFRDVARLSDAPLVSSHSAAHAICASTRNLTDDQLRMIRDSGGLVGLNFAAGFLRDDGRRLPFQGYGPFLRHLDHLLHLLGDDGVAFGSDFDGALLPDSMPDAAALPGLLQAMQDHGFGQALIEKIAHRNWLSVLERTWGA